MKYRSLEYAIMDAEQTLRRYGTKVHTDNWQGIDIASRPEAEMIEYLYFNFEAPLPVKDLDYYQTQIRPNLPFADLAFLERISGIAMNPGEAWKSWPWAHSANNHRENSGQFEHTYQERHWPIDTQARGIRFPIGDTNDMIHQLAHDPYTRQAYLPIFFPEDTGFQGRKPCTLGYLFLMRDNKLDITYYIRSCDLYRHFRDDIYMTVRLLLWVLVRCQNINPDVWSKVTPGKFRMDIGSLHVFVNDAKIIWGDE